MKLLTFPGVINPLLSASSIIAMDGLVISNLNSQ